MDATEPVVDVVVRDAEEAVVAAAVLARQAAAVRVHRLNGLHGVGSHEDRARLHRGGVILSSTGGKISQFIQCTVHWAQQREKSAGGWLGVNFGIVLIDNKVKKSPKPNVSFKGTSNVVVPANPLT